MPETNTQNTAAVNAGMPDPQRQVASYSQAKGPRDAYIGEILSVLMGFSYSEISLKSVSGVLQKHLGDNWRATVYDCLAGVDEDHYSAAVAKLDELFTYENALAAWSEAVGYTQNPNVMLSVNMVERLEALEYWLKFFGEEGLGLFGKVKLQYEALANANGMAQKNEYMQQAEGMLQNAVQQKPSEEQQVEEKGNVELENLHSNLRHLGHLDKNLLWEFNYFLELCSYYDRTMSRIAARCVKQALKMEQYPHVSYAFDVLEEIVDVANSIFDNSESAEVIEAIMPEGVLGFEGLLKYYTTQYDIVSGKGEELEEDADMLNGVDRKMFVEQLGFVDRASKDGKSHAGEEEKQALKNAENLNKQDAKKNVEEIKKEKAETTAENTEDNSNAES